MCHQRIGLNYVARDWTYIIPRGIVHVKCPLSNLIIIRVQGYEQGNDIIQHTTHFYTRMQ